MLKLINPSKARRKGNEFSKYSSYENKNTLQSCSLKYELFVLLLLQDFQNVTLSFWNFICDELFTISTDL